MELGTSGLLARVLTSWSLLLTVFRTFMSWFILLCFFNKVFFFLSPGGARDRTQRLAHARQGFAAEQQLHSPGYVLWVSHTGS